MHKSNASKKVEPVLTVEDAIKLGTQVEITLSESLRQRRELSKLTEA